ncbi:DUF5819 family protein [Kitasatospora sp. P5_F3]
MVKLGWTGPSRALDGTPSGDVKGPIRKLADGAVIAAGPPGPLVAAVTVAVALCLAASLVHVLLVFMYVAPPNQLSQAYSRQINAWINPLFEQNWRLFAPDPESATRQVSVRTARTSRDGTRQVGDWFDLSAVDDSDVKHNVFPSHTTQNMLRRAWAAYLESHGSDDKPHSERARMLQEYLRNIAVERVAAHQDSTFDAVQLRVITQPIAAPTTAGGPRPVSSTPVDTRYLPWWKVAPDGN